MDNYDLFGDDLTNGMLDTLAELGATESAYVSSSHGLPPVRPVNAETLLQGFSSQPPSYTQIGSNTTAKLASTPNSGQSFSEYSNQYGTYSSGQLLGGYPHHGAHPSRPMASYPSYHDSNNIVTQNVQYTDYVSQNPALLRSPAVHTVQQPLRTTNPNSMQHHFSPYRGASQNSIYAHQVQQWNEQQAYGAIPHQYSSGPSMSYRPSASYANNLIRSTTPMSQSPAPLIQSTDHSIPYMSRPQAVPNLPQTQYSQNAYMNSTQPYADYQQVQPAPRVHNMPPTASYPINHTQYSMGVPQNNQYATQYRDYYSQSPRSSLGPPAQANPHVYPISYGQIPISAGYRQTYTPLNQSSPRPPLTSPRPLVQSPLPPTLNASVVSSAHQTGATQSTIPHNQGPSSLQQLEQMVMPHVSKNSPSPKLISGGGMVLSPISGPRGPISPNQTISPTPWSNSQGRSAHVPVSNLQFLQNQPPSIPMNVLESAPASLTPTETRRSDENCVVSLPAGDSTGYTCGFMNDDKLEGKSVPRSEPVKYVNSELSASGDISSSSNADSKPYINESQTNFDRNLDIVSNQSVNLHSINTSNVSSMSLVSSDENICSNSKSYTSVFATTHDFKSQGVNDNFQTALPQLGTCNSQTSLIVETPDPSKTADSTLADASCDTRNLHNSQLTSTHGHGSFNSNTMPSGIALPSSIPVHQYSQILSATGESQPQQQQRYYQSMGLTPHFHQLVQGLDNHEHQHIPQVPPSDRIQYEYDYEMVQLQQRLQHLYSCPSSEQIEFQIAQLQDQIRTLKRQHEPKPSYQPSIAPLIAQDEMTPGQPCEGILPPTPTETGNHRKGRQKVDKKPREPKKAKAGKGKACKDLWGDSNLQPESIPNVGPEVYEFHDAPTDVPEKKPKKPRKPREQKTSKEIKTKELKTPKPKQQRKWQSKKCDDKKVAEICTDEFPTQLDLENEVKTDETFILDQKNEIGATSTTVFEGDPIELSNNGNGGNDADNQVYQIDAEVDVLPLVPPLASETTILPKPKKRSKPKVKSGTSKKRPSKTLIASLSLRRKKRKGSDSEVSDMATPPPSPTEEEGSNKRRSGRHSNRKKYIEDLDMALSDDDILLPTKLASGNESSELPIIQANESPTTASLASVSAPATSVSAITPIKTEEICGQGHSQSNKPNFVYVNPADEDTMIVQHILAMRLGKREMISSSSEDDEPKEADLPSTVAKANEVDLPSTVAKANEVDLPSTEATEVVLPSTEANEVDLPSTEAIEVDLPSTQPAAVDVDSSNLILKIEPPDYREEIEECHNSLAKMEDDGETNESREHKNILETTEHMEKSVCTMSDNKSEMQDIIVTEAVEIKLENTCETIESRETDPNDALKTDEVVLKEITGGVNVKKLKQTIPEIIEVEEYYVKYKSFSYLHCEWKTEDELLKGDKRVAPKIRRFKQRMNQRDIFEFLEEDPFNPEYTESDRILDMSEVKDPVTGTATKNYLVKWRALPYDECTWELEDDIDPSKLKQFHRFYSPPTKDQWKLKKRPKPDEWVKLDESPVYKNGNTLRPYQLEGLNWLSFSWFNGRNCILADEMGLGKTIQSLTFIESVINCGIRGPFLVIAPLSTVPNWQREFETWTDLNVIVYHGSVASRNMIQEYELHYRHPDNPLMNIKDVYKFNVLITTFEIVLTDVFDLKDIPFRVCIIDEAHRLKNKNCKLLEGLRLLNLEHRVLLSGTPLQNNINELFSLLNFLEPSQFVSSDQFVAEFGELTSETQVQKLQALLKPMMLRRLKEDVEKSIAPKQETIIEVELTNMQKKYYRAILERNFSFLSKGTSVANIPNLMNTMMELRKCCIHPYLLNGAEEQIQMDYRLVHNESESDPDPDLYHKALITSSGKMVLVDKLLPKLKANGHRVLVFSQMVRCLDILEDYLIFRKYPYERLDGRIRGPMRQAAIDRFSKPDSDRFVFLLCTKAGGLGINLTAADTVIIYDSDWNPQNDLQAQARCHRIGQAKMVKVYRLICRNTYEREMFDRASLKLGLDKAVLQSMNTGGAVIKGTDAPSKQLSKKEVEDLLKKGAYGALMDEDNAGDKFCEEDIDCILQRRTQIITLETGGEKGSTFSKASFSSTGIREDINIDDPDFWTKWAKKADIDIDDVNQKNELLMNEPRRRTQIKRYGHDEAVMEISEPDTSTDSDEDGNIGERTRGRGRRKEKSRRSRRNLDDDFHCDDGIVEYGRWSRSECYKIEKGLLSFGWSRWTEILIQGVFRVGWKEKDVEDCARIMLVHCVKNFRGDEKVKLFIQDLISPTESGSGKLTRNHSGLANPVSRGCRKNKSILTEGLINTSMSSPETIDEWSKDERYDPDLHLDDNYKKHIGKHANKVLLRIRMLYYIKQEIIGDFAAKITLGVPTSELDICPSSLVLDPGPRTWWDRDADTSLLIGTYKHGYERYSLMRSDAYLCFLARCGPPDGKTDLDETCCEINEEELDKVAIAEDDEEEETSLAEPVVEKLDPAPIAPVITEPTDTADSEKSWPSASDLNTRIRKLITSFQRNFKKEEIKNAQKLKRLERKEKIDKIVRDRERQKLEVYQKRWSKKEESDFYRTVSSYGVQFNRKEKKYDWSKFRVISRLDKKFDETLREYFRAFYSMCKRISGRKLSEEEEFDLIQVPVEPLPEERARRTLDRIDLLCKVREEIIYHSQLEEKLKLCLPSLDLPEWWVPGMHDKDLLLGAARHGLGRTDVFFLNDPDLCFKEVLQNQPVDFDYDNSSKLKSTKPEMDSFIKHDKQPIPGMVDIEIQDIKKDRINTRKLIASEQDNLDFLGLRFTEESLSVAQPEVKKSEDSEDNDGETILDKLGNKKEKRSLDESSKGYTSADETVKTFCQSNDFQMDTLASVNPDTEKCNLRWRSSNTSFDETECKNDAAVATVKKEDEESSNFDMNEVQVEIKDELKITIKLSSEKMKRVEVQVKGSPKFTVPEPPPPEVGKKLPTPDVVSNSEIPGQILNQGNSIRWPRDRAIQLRLEHIVHAVEYNEWPVSRFFTSAGVADLLDYAPPQDTFDTNTTSLRDAPTPVLECTEKTRPDEKEMVVNQPVPSRRGRRRRIAIDVEADRAKLQALLNQTNVQNAFNKTSIKQESTDKRNYDGVESSKFQPPPAHQQHFTSSSSSILRNQQKRHPQTSFTFQPQISTLDLSIKPSHLNNPVDAETMSALSSLSSVTVTPLNMSSGTSSMISAAPMDLSSRISTNRDSSRQEMPVRHYQVADPIKEKVRQSKLENMLDKLKKRKMEDTELPIPVVPQKEKKRKKLDEIVLGLSAAKTQHSSVPPRCREKTSCSRDLQGEVTQKALNESVVQSNLFSNPLLSATLSLFNSPAGKEFSRQLAHQQATLNKKDGTGGSFQPSKCDLSRLTELAVPKFDLFSQDAKVNKWLAEHANLTPERPVTPDLVDGRRRRRPRVDPTLLDWSKLSGEENVAVINRLSGKKVTGPKAPELKHLSQWLLENPLYDVDTRWADLVRAKGSLPSDLLKRISGEGKKASNCPSTLDSPLVNSSCAEAAPTSSSSAYSSPGTFNSIAGFSSANQNLLANLPFGSVDPKNPLFMPFGGLGSLGNLSSLGNIGSLSGLSGLGLTNSLFGFGLPSSTNTDSCDKGSKELFQKSGSESNGRKSENKGKVNTSQNVLSSALPFLFSNPGLMYNPLGLGSFAMGNGANAQYGNFGVQNSFLGGLGNPKKNSTSSNKSASKSQVSGLNSTSLPKKQSNLLSSGLSHVTKAAGLGESQKTSLPTIQDESDDESMKSLMDNHTDDLPDDDSPNEHAERVVIKESKELEKELAQQKNYRRNDRNVRERFAADLHRGGLTTAERQLLMVKKKERLAKEENLPIRESGRTTRRSAAAVSRNTDCSEDAVNKTKRVK